MEALKKEEDAKYKGRNVLTAYVKTGIMYDEDCQTRAGSVIGLQDLLQVLTPYAKQTTSEILCDYVAYLQGIAKERDKADKMIDCGNYSAAFETRYGQYSFLNRVFDTRSKTSGIGKTDPNNVSALASFDYIYAGTNSGGRPWIQYCFWGQQYTRKSEEEAGKPSKHECHYLFWRLDCNWERKNKADKQSKYEAVYYLALRHYDENAKSKDEAKNERKRKVYDALREAAKKINDPYKVFQEFGRCENNKESNLIFIPVRDLSIVGDFKELQSFLQKITTEMKAAANAMERY